MTTPVRRAMSEETRIESSDATLASDTDVRARRLDVMFGDADKGNAAT